MKKYVNLVVFTIFIVITISYLYIDANNVSRYFPNFHFKTIAGDEETIKDLVITGDFHYDYFGFEPFRIDTEGTAYFRHEPFFKKLNGYYKQKDIERLQREYKSFMRGKDEFSGLFYETEHLLVYGSVSYDVWSLNSEQFEIAVLDKETNETISFQTPIPNIDDYLYLDTRKIFVIDDEVFIVTVNERAGNNEDVYLGEVYVYTFDINERQLTYTEKIGEIEHQNADNDGYSDVQILLDDQHANVMLFEYDVTYMEESTNDMFAESIEIDHIMKYDLKTHEKEEITIKETKLGVPIAFVEDELFFVEVDRQKLFVTNYHLQKDSIIDRLEAGTVSMYFSYGELYEPLVEGGKFYCIPTFIDESMESTVTVIDLLNFDVIYEGKVELVQPLDTIQDSSIYFNHIELRNE